MATNVLEDAWLIIIDFIQRFGWFAVFTVIALYFSWPQIEAYRKARSLADANNPQRRAVLDAQRLRVRLQQQKALEGENETENDE